MSPLRAIWRRVTTCPCGCEASRWWYYGQLWNRGFGRGRWAVEETPARGPWKMYSTGHWTRRSAERALREPLLEDSTSRIIRVKEMDK